MPVAARFSSQSCDGFQGEVFARGGGNAIAVPSGCPVEADVLFRHHLLQELKGCAQAAIKLLPLEIRRLRLRIVQIENIDCFAINIAESAPDLALQLAWRQ